MDPVALTLDSIARLTAADRAWLDLCRSVCKDRLPKAIFERIPAAIWKFVPWGHRMVVLRVPMQDRLGRIIVPDMAKKENTIGWVLTVGRALGVPSNHLAEIAPPLDGMAPEVLDAYGVGAQYLALVGTPVLFSQWAGKPIKMTAYEDIWSAIDGDSPFVVFSVSDVWGPYIDLDESEWKVPDSIVAP